MTRTEQLLAVTFFVCVILSVYFGMMVVANGGI